MADSSTVCSMCGDIGFSDKLFRCMRCLFRFQHSYCSNHYTEENASMISAAQVCDWCLSEEPPKLGPSNFKKSGSFKRPGNKSDSEQEETGSRPIKGPTSTSPKPTGP